MEQIRLKPNLLPDFVASAVFYLFRSVPAYGQDSKFRMLGVPV